MTEEIKQSDAGQPGEAQAQPASTSPSTPLFPHDIPSEHWDVDFSNSKETYQETDLPVWILAGWATFILWAIIYLFSGLSAL
jgi:hypothetical protein